MAQYLGHRVFQFIGLDSVYIIPKDIHKMQGRDLTAFLHHCTKNEMLEQYLKYLPSLIRELM
jgi:hypothetical protein